MNHETLFLLHIADGYSFRNTLGTIKSETDSATMVLSPKSVEISFMNTSKCAVHRITICTSEVATYEYNVRDTEGNLVENYPIAFETSELANTTKSIGKRDGIRIFLHSGEDHISVQPVKANAKDPSRVGALFVKILNREHSRFQPPSSYASEPNVMVLAKDFSDICTQANTVKCSYLGILGQTTGVIFQGILPNNGLAFYTRFSSQTSLPMIPQTSPPINMEEIDDLISCLRHDSPQQTRANGEASSSVTLNVIKSDEFTTIRIPIITAKALSKFHNISPPGTLLSFYFAEGMPAKIESPIGTYGIYTLCIRDLQ